MSCSSDDDDDGDDGGGFLHAQGALFSLSFYA
jgi:hypothetical protein